MALNVRLQPDTAVLYLDTTISTNNYAMQLVSADKARHGTTVVAGAQTGGKGQRGNVWLDEPGRSLLMSVVLVPAFPLEQQFCLSAAVAVAIADYLTALLPDARIFIKWPNDILINDKKAGGILIENVLRGSNWLYAIVGFGLNVLQDHFPPILPHATSLLLASGIRFVPSELAVPIRDRLLGLQPDGVMAAYNKYLYCRSAIQQFSDESGVWEAQIVDVLPDGRLQLLHGDGTMSQYRHGSIHWIW